MIHFAGWSHIQHETRNSVITQGPHGALCQLKSCQLLHSCMGNHIWKGMQSVNDV